MHNVSRNYSVVGKDSIVLHFLSFQAFHFHLSESDDKKNHQPKTSQNQFITNAHVCHKICSIFITLILFNRKVTN